MLLGTLAAGAQATEDVAHLLEADGEDEEEEEAAAYQRFVPAQPEWGKGPPEPWVLVLIALIQWQNNQVTAPTDGRQ